MELVCFTSSKGGVGTSQLVAKIAKMSSQMGYKCLVADLNAKRRTLDIYLGVTDSFVYDINDVCNNICTFEDALVRVNDNLEFIPCSQNNDIDDYYNVYHMLKQKGIKYDFIFTDAPFDKCDVDSKVVLVTTCEDASLRCTEKLSCDLQNNKKYLIINKIDVDLILNKINPNIDDICDLCGVSPIGLVLYDRDYFAGTKLNSLCEKSFENIVKRLNGIHVPAIDFQSKKTKNIFSRR